MDYSLEIGAAYSDVCSRHTDTPMTAETLEVIRGEIDAEFEARGIPAKIVELKWNRLNHVPVGSVSVWRTLDIAPGVV